MIKTLKLLDLGRSSGTKFIIVNWQIHFVIFSDFVPISSEQTVPHHDQTRGFLARNGGKGEDQRLEKLNNFMNDNFFSAMEAVGH